MKTLMRHRKLLFTLFLFILVLATSALADDGEKRDSMAFWQAFTLPRVWVSYVVGLLGFLLLIKGWVGKRVRLAGLGVALFLFGVLEGLHLGAVSTGMGMHPSPICMLEKPVIFLSKGMAVPVFFFGMILSVALLNLIGNKFFCGWVCPVGAIQELVHKLPLPKLRVPFKISNTVRVLFFAAFVLVTFLLRLSLFEYVNAFHFFHWDWYWMSMLILGVVLMASLFIFRPFCYFLCPMGLFSWLLEHVALFRVYKKEVDCGKCRLCVEKSPCPAVSAIVEGRWSRPDCHACGACIDLCPNKNLSFRMRKRR